MLQGGDFTRHNVSFPPPPFFTGYRVLTFLSGTGHRW
jgi:hypothetical protein